MQYRAARSPSKRRETIVLRVYGCYREAVRVRAHDYQLAGRSKSVD
jgi:hypothetical protein